MSGQTASSAAPGGTRAEAKGRTRRAILDAALDLTEQTPLAAISLRQIAKEVGIVPTAFYRHFATLEELGLALVEESFVSLRAMLRDLRTPESLTSPVHIADTSVAILIDHLHRQRAHFAFIARERNAAMGTVREAIRREIALCEFDLATDLARLPPLQAWPAADVRALSHLIVTSMVSIAEEIIASRAEQEAALAQTARIQLRMVVVGALNWAPET